MLTADLAINRKRGGRVYPHHISPDDGAHLRIAEDLIRIVRDHTGKRRTELDSTFDDYIGTATDYRVMRGLIKLLMDRCEFGTAGTIDPLVIRQTLFMRAAAHHPVLNNDEVKNLIISETANELNCSADQIISGLYGDISDNQQVLSFDEFSPQELISRYNLAQAQALLYKCTELKLWIEPQNNSVTRTLFSEIKAFRLIHSIQGIAYKGYEVTLNGPVSIFHRSQKYGIRMATFLPALLLCEGWRMSAEIETKSGSAFYELDSNQDNLTSHYISDERSVEKSVQDKLLTSWPALNSDWIIESNREVIDLDYTAFIPDMVFKKENSPPLYLEIFGYWTPKYLKDRLADFERAGFDDFIIAVSEEMFCSRDLPAKLHSNVFMYKKTLNAKELNSFLKQKRVESGE